MKPFALVFAFALLGLAQADTINDRRVSEFDWRCTDADGNKISDHNRIEKAFVACWNNPAGKYVQGGRYEVIRTTSVPAPPSKPPANRSTMRWKPKYWLSWTPKYVLCRRGPDAPL